MTPSTSEATSAVTAVGILDTSVVIELPNLSAADLPALPTISVVTLAELSVGPEVSKNSHERAMRQLVLQQTEASFDPLPFDAACARRFAIVAGCLRQSGRKTQARAFDALIAATALAHNLPLYTRNAQDFEGIDGLDLRPVTPNI
jgi:predicted nucleic acid-binding protein